MHKVDQRGPSSQGEANDLSTGFMVAFDQVKLVFFFFGEREKEKAQKRIKERREQLLSQQVHMSYIGSN